jgi:uncharacterized protein (TIGR02145 family)
MMKNNLFNTLITFLLFSSFSYTQNDKIKDIDGNLYSFDSIGNQVWMTENLRVTHFNDGTPIYKVSNKFDWNESDTYSWCYFEDNSTYNLKFGKLYNGYVINTDLNVCPVGWRLPSVADWQILIHFLGGDSIAGYKMKSPLKIKSFVQKNEIGGYFEYNNVECSNCKLWNEEYRSKVPCHICKDTRIKKIKGKFIPKKFTTKKVTINSGWDGLKESVFKALPSGKRFSLLDELDFEDKDAACYFWSSSFTSTGSYESPFLITSENSIQFWVTRKEDGCSIRCIKVD